MPSAERAPTESPALPYDTSKLNDYSGATARKAVTVFCWSRTEPGTKLWDDAEAVGRACANEGFTVYTGGYCGSMEAVSKGAREVVDQLPESTINKPEVVGVLVPGQFPDRKLVGNRFLTTSIDAENMPRRVEMLTALSRYYVILPGTLGTLQELTQIWILSLLHPGIRPVIICFRDPWEQLITSVATLLKLPADNTALIQYVDNADEMISIIRDDFAKLPQS